MRTDKYKVLLVDDSADDRFFQRIILERSQNFVVVGEASDGQEAMDYLQRANDCPDLVLLDLKMPGKNGFDVLQWVQDSNLKKLTIAVMSGSWLAEDIAKSFALGAHTYFKKSSLRSDQDQMIVALEKLLGERQNVASHDL